MIHNSSFRLSCDNHFEFLISSIFISTQFLHSAPYIYSTLSIHILLLYYVFTLRALIHTHIHIAYLHFSHVRNLSTNKTVFSFLLFVFLLFYFYFPFFLLFTSVSFSFRDILVRSCVCRSGCSIGTFTIFNFFFN